MHNSKPWRPPRLCPWHTGPWPAPKVRRHGAEDSFPFQCSSCYGLPPPSRESLCPTSRYLGGLFARAVVSAPLSALSPCLCPFTWQSTPAPAGGLPGEVRSPRTSSCCVYLRERDLNVEIESRSLTEVGPASAHCPLCAHDGDFPSYPAALPFTLNFQEGLRNRKTGPLPSNPGKKGKGSGCWMKPCYLTVGGI